VRDLVAVYQEILSALDARALVRAAAARVPEPAAGGKLFLFGLGKAAAEMFEGARAAGVAGGAMLAVP